MLILEEFMDLWYKKSKEKEEKIKIKKYIFLFRDEIDNIRKIREVMVQKKVKKKKKK